MNTKMGTPCPADSMLLQRARGKPEQGDTGLCCLPLAGWQQAQLTALQRVVVTPANSGVYACLVSMLGLKWKAVGAADCDGVTGKGSTMLLPCGGGHSIFPTAGQCSGQSVRHSQTGMQL